MITNLIHKINLEETLVANWTKFVDYKKLFAFVTDHICDMEFPKLDKKIKVKGPQIKISRFELADSGFVVWVEFSIPRNDVVVGTIEFHVFSDGTVEHIQTIGNEFRKT
jgi:hypothetical protein